MNHQIYKVCSRRVGLRDFVAMSATTYSLCEICVTRASWSRLSSSTAAWPRSTRPRTGHTVLHSSTFSSKVESLKVNNEEMLCCRNQYSSLLQNHQKLRTEYQKLLSVTSELTAGLEDVAQARLGPGQGQVDWKNVKF